MTEAGTGAADAFHGRTLAYVLLAFSLASSLGCLAGARALNFYHDDPSGGQDGPSAPEDPVPTPSAPPGRTVRWTHKLMRRSRPVRPR